MLYFCFLSLGEIRPRLIHVASYKSFGPNAPKVLYGIQLIHKAAMSLMGSMQSVGPLVPHGRPGLRGPEDQWAMSSWVRSRALGYMEGQASAQTRSGQKNMSHVQTNKSPSATFVCCSHFRLQLLCRTITNVTEIYACNNSSLSNEIVFACQSLH
jgi:hypothetical protein